MTQAVCVYRDVITQIDFLQTAVNNLVQSNTQSGKLLGANLISANDMTALTNAMTTLQADRVALKNTNPPYVAGN